MKDVMSLPVIRGKVVWEAVIVCLVLSHLYFFLNLNVRTSHGRHIFTQ